MTIARRKLTTLDKLKVVVAQAICPLCGGRLGELDGLDFDHATALALGGADEVENLRAVHRDCHAIKTRGAGATTAGTDIGRIAKVKRIAKDPAGGEEFRRRLLAKAEGEPPPETKKRKHQWPSRPLGKGKAQRRTP